MWSQDIKLLLQLQNHIVEIFLMGDRHVVRLKFVNLMVLVNSKPSCRSPCCFPVEKKVILIITTNNHVPKPPQSDSRIGFVPMSPTQIVYLFSTIYPHHAEVAFLKSVLIGIFNTRALYLAIQAVLL